QKAKFGGRVVSSYDTVRAVQLVLTSDEGRDCVRYPVILSQQFGRFEWFLTKQQRRRPIHVSTNGEHGIPINGRVNRMMTASGPYRTNCKTSAASLSPFTHHQLCPKVQLDFSRCGTKISFQSSGRRRKAHLP